jgi:hypothetical protein
VGDSKRNSRARWKKGNQCLEVVNNLNNFFPRTQKNVDNFLDGRTKGSTRPANGDIRAPLASTKP